MAGILGSLISSITKPLGGGSPGHGPKSPQNSGWVDPKPYDEVYAPGVFRGYERDDLWIYFRLPEDVKVEWNKSKDESLANQHFFIEIVNTLADKITNQTQRSTRDKRRRFHLQLTQEVKDSIDPYPGCTPAHADYLRRVAEENSAGERLRKPVWNGYIGFQVEARSAFEGADTTAQKWGRYKDMWVNPDAIQQHMYVQDMEELTDLAIDLGFQPLDFSENLEDMENLTAWHGVSDDKYGLPRQLESTRMQELKHGMSLIVPRWGEITFHAIKPADSLFMMDPHSNQMRWTDPLMMPASNVVCINVRGEIRSRQVADNLFSQKRIRKIEDQIKSSKSDTMAASFTDMERSAIDSSRLDKARQSSNMGNGMLDNVEIVVATKCREGEKNFLPMLMQPYDMQVVPLIGRQPIALNNTFPCYPRPIFPIPVSNTKRSVLSNQMFAGVIGLSGILRRTRPCAPGGILMGLSEAGHEYVEVYTDVEGANKQSGVPGMLITGRPGAGKALALDTLVETPDGHTRMGDLQIGDTVIGSNGKPCAVTFVTDVQHDRRVYRFTLEDGQTFLADRDHQWLINPVDNRERANHLGTSEWMMRLDEVTRDVADRLYRYIDGLDQPEAKVNPDELHEIVTTSIVPSSPWTSPEMVSAALDFADYLPDEDGKYQLSEALSRLAARSGQIAPVMINNGICVRATTGEMLEMDPDDLFVPVLDGFLRISSITEVDTVPVRCISVDSPDSTYRIGDGVVTSNTQQMLQIASQVKYQEFRVFFLNPKPDASLKPSFDLLGGLTINMNAKYLRENPGLMDPMFFMDDRREIQALLYQSIVLACGLQTTGSGTSAQEVVSKRTKLQTELFDNLDDPRNRCSWHVIFGNQDAGTEGISDEGIRDQIQNKIKSSPFWTAFISSDGDKGSELRRQITGGRPVLVEWDKTLSLPSVETKLQEYNDDHIDSIISITAFFKYAVDVIGHGRSGGTIICDEAWVLKSSPDAMRILQKGAREWRQSNIMLILGTQKITDFIGGEGDEDLSTYFARFLFMAISENSQDELDLFFRLTGLQRTPEIEKYIVSAGIKSEDGRSQDKIAPRAFYLDRLYGWSGSLICGPWPDRELSAGRTDKAGELSRAQSALKSADVERSNTTFGGFLNQISVENKDYDERIKLSAGPMVEPTDLEPRHEDQQ